MPSNYVNPDPPPFAVAVKCANFAAGTMAVITALMYALCPTERVTLGPDHLTVRFGYRDENFPYASITQATIERNAKVPEVWMLKACVPGSRGLERLLRL